MGDDEIEIGEKNVGRSVITRGSELELDGGLEMENGKVDVGIKNAGEVRDVGGGLVFNVGSGNLVGGKPKKKVSKVHKGHHVKEKGSRLHILGVKGRNAWEGRMTWMDLMWR